MKKAVVLLAEGAEEMEAVITMDILTRSGMRVTSASLTEKKTVLCSRGTVIKADKSVSEVMTQGIDVVVLPGGVKGAENLRDSHDVIEMLRRVHQSGGLVAAICAAPALVLAPHHLFPDATMTGFPAMQHAIPNWSDERVCYDETAGLITSQGPGTSFEFALKIVEVVLDKGEADKVAKPLVLPESILR